MNVTMDLEVFENAKVSIGEPDSGLSNYEKLSTLKKPLECNKLFKCGRCYSVFKEKQEVLRHVRLHADESCSYCSKTFTTKLSLDIHQLTHKGKKPPVCSYCGKKFLSRSVLKIHERIHTGEKPYSCGYCSKMCATKSQLNQHERIHTSEKPFACNVCNSKFRVICVLVKHKRIHTGEKPFTCNYCGVRFRQQSTLNTHKKRYCKGISNPLQLDGRSTLPNSYQTHSPDWNIPSEQKPFDFSVAAETLLSYDEETVRPGVESSSVVEVMSVEASDVFVTDSKPF